MNFQDRFSSFDLGLFQVIFGVHPRMTSTQICSSTMRLNLLDAQTKCQVSHTSLMQIVSKRSSSDLLATKPVEKTGVGIQVDAVAGS